MSVRVEVVATHTCSVCGEVERQAEAVGHDAQRATYRAQLLPNGWLKVGPGRLERANPPEAAENLAAGITAGVVCGSSCAAVLLSMQHGTLVQRLMDGRP